jgi:hypothetical protein
MSTAPENTRRVQVVGALLGRAVHATAKAQPEVVLSRVLHAGAERVAEPASPEARHSRGYPDVALGEVAERVGYGSASTFSTALSRHVGPPAATRGSGGGRGEFAHRARLGGPPVVHTERMPQHRQANRILRIFTRCLRSYDGAQMLAFLMLFGSGLSGYALAPVFCWPAATLGLMSVSLARHYVLIRRGVEAGLEEPITEALLRSCFNALVATGACYWSGVAVRAASTW